MNKRDYQSTNYINSITGLRGVAILAVLFYHSKYSWFQNGFFGVDVFFVISGFLISRLILKKFGEDNFSFRLFYLKRIRRLFPALFFLILFSYFIVYFYFLPEDIENFQNSVIYTIFFISNIFFWKDTNYFSNETSLKPLSHTWSLGIEEQFYIIFPFLIYLLVKNFKKNLKFILIAIAIASFFYSASEKFYHIPIDCFTEDCIRITNFYWLHSRLWEFLIGVTINLFDFKFFKKDILNIAGGFLIIISFSGFFKLFNHPGYVTLLPVFGTFLVIVNAHEKNFINKFLESKFIVFIGKISYSLYLFHFPIFAFSNYYYFEVIILKSYNIIFFVLIIISIFISFLMWKYIEEPIRRNQFLNNKNLLLLVLTLSISLIFVSLLEVDGISKKYIPQNIVAEFPVSSDQIDEMDICLMETEEKNLDIQYCLRNYDDKKNNFLIIGDSLSQNIFWGLENNVSSDFTLSYLGVTGCMPFVTNFNFDTGNYGVEKCKKHYSKVKKVITSFDFQKIIIVYNHLEFQKLNTFFNSKVDLFELFFDEVKNFDNSKILIVGQPINWKDSLPRMTLKNFRFSKTEFSQLNGRFLKKEIFNIDDKMKNLTNIYDVEYISILDEYCEDNKCKVYTLENSNLYLTSIDSIHLTKHSALKIGKLILDSLYE